MHSLFQTKSSAITSLVALTGAPAPGIIPLLPSLDDTAKVFAILYSAVGIAFIIYQWVRARKGGSPL